MRSSLFHKLSVSEYTVYSRAPTRTYRSEPGFLPVRRHPNMPSRKLQSTEQGAAPWGQRELPNRGTRICGASFFSLWISLWILISQAGGMAAGDGLHQPLLPEGPHQIWMWLNVEERGMTFHSGCPGISYGFWFRLNEYLLRRKSESHISTW